MTDPVDSAPELASLVLAPEEDDTSDDLGARRSAAQRAYVAVRGAILDGTLHFGTALSEDALAAQLGVSRTPVREALQTLTREGLLEQGARRTLVVREPTPKLCDEVLMMRIALECETVARACEVGSEEDFDKIKLTVFRQERESRRAAVAGFIEADGDFHFEFARTAQLPLVHKTLVQLHTFTRLLGLKALEREGRMNQVIGEHEAVLAALEARDAEAARAAMRVHLENTGDVLNLGLRGRGKDGK